MTLQELLYKHSIDTAPDGHKHNRYGWTNVVCPFCTGNPGYHLGFPNGHKTGNCHRCGTHTLTEFLSKYLAISLRDASVIAKRVDLSDVVPQKHGATAKILDLPPLCGPLKPQHTTYLAKRKFDHDILARTWNIMGTGYCGPYKHRIIAPIYWKGVLVSYQGRDITGKATLKYKACSEDLEVVHHKDILYGMDLCPYQDRVIVVEGVFDVWRLGPGAVSTFGVEYTPAQFLLLSKMRQVFVLYDTDEKGQGQRKSAQLASDLALMGVDTEIIELDEGDPAEMEDRDAKHLMQTLFGRSFTA